MRRFVNADIVSGEITNAITLNRYAYANGNPVSNIDPFGLSAERSNITSTLYSFNWEKFTDQYFVSNQTISFLVNEQQLDAIYLTLTKGILDEPRPNNIGKGTWAKIVQNDLDWVEQNLGKNSTLAKSLNKASYVSVVVEATVNGIIDFNNGANLQTVLVDTAVDIGFGLGGAVISSVVSGATASMASGALLGTSIGTAVPGLGNVIGAVAGTVIGIGYYALTECVEINGKSISDWTKTRINWLFDQF